MKRIMAVVFVLLGCAAIASAQSAGYDFFQTGSGTSVDLSSMGVGVVQLQGNPIPGAPGYTDTMIHRTQNMPTGGGNVPVEVHALFLKSTSSVTFQGQQADVYVTINNTGGTISTSVLPQPDSLSSSGGNLAVRTDGTFDSNITVNADLIFVKAGASVTDSTNYLGHQAAPSTNLSSTNSTWSTTPPSGYPPANSTFPSGGFYPIVVGGGGHSTPSHVHGVVPAQRRVVSCFIENPTLTTEAKTSTTTTKTKGTAGTTSSGTPQSAPSGSMMICYE